MAQPTGARLQRVTRAVSEREAPWETAGLCCCQFEIYPSSSIDFNLHNKQLPTLSKRDAFPTKRHKDEPCAMGLNLAGRKWQVFDGGLSVTPASLSPLAPFILSGNASFTTTYPIG